METISIPRTCSYSTLRPISLSHFRVGEDQRFSSKRRTQQTLSVEALKRARLTSLCMIPRYSAINEQTCSKGPPAIHFERMASDGISITRFNEELVRRSVRSEEERSENSDGDKQGEPNLSGLQLWIRRAYGMQTTAQVFCSAMFWIVLFFIASMWDGEDESRIGRRDRR